MRVENLTIGIDVRPIRRTLFRYAFCPPLKEKHFPPPPEFSPPTTYLRREPSFLHHPQDFRRFDVRVDGQFFEMKGEMLTTELRAKVEITHADLPERGVGEEALGVLEDDVLAEAAAVLALPEDRRGVGREIQLAAVMQQVGQMRRHPPVGQVTATVLDDGVQVELERGLGKGVIVQSVC